MIHNNSTRSGHFENGIIKRTSNQRKKHISQMTNNEISYLNSKLSNVYLSMSKHISEKLDNFYIKDLVNMVRRKEYNIIEYNETQLNDELQHRVLIRSEKTFIVDIVNNNGSRNDMECNLCVVICIDTGKVITAYYNECNDDHATILMSRYDENIKIC